MYNICKNVIMSARFELSDMLRKIDTLWLQSEITDEQKSELEKLAREHADPTMSADLTKRIEDHETRIRSLEEQMAGRPVPEPEPDPDVEEGTPEWPGYDPKKGYRNGDKITFKGKHYTCTLPEHTEVCYWSPESYPDYWKAEEVA